MCHKTYAWNKNNDLRALYETEPGNDLFGQNMWFNMTNL